MQIYKHCCCCSWLSWLQLIEASPCCAHRPMHRTVQRAAYANLQALLLLQQLAELAAAHRGFTMLCTQTNAPYSAKSSLCKSTSIAAVAAG